METRGNGRVAEITDTHRPAVAERGRNQHVSATRRHPRDLDDLGFPATRKAARESAQHDCCPVTCHNGISRVYWSSSSASHARARSRRRDAGSVPAGVPNLRSRAPGSRAPGWACGRTHPPAGRPARLSRSRQDHVNGHRFGPGARNPLQSFGNRLPNIARVVLPQSTLVDSQDRGLRLGIPRRTTSKHPVVGGVIERLAETPS